VVHREPAGHRLRGVLDLRGDVMDRLDDREFDRLGVVLGLSAGLLVHRRYLLAVGDNRSDARNPGPVPTTEGSRPM
jgi:hypothetical protein